MNRGQKTVAALAVLSAALIAVPPAPAAVPKRGRWQGITSQGRPIKFKVAKKKRRRILKSFEIGTSGPPPVGVKIGCSPDPNDYVDSHFTTPDTIHVRRSGRFSITFDTKGRITKGTLKVSGRFRTKKKLKGKLRWKVKRTDDGRSCDSGDVTFTVRKK